MNNPVILRKVYDRTSSELRKKVLDDKGEVCVCSFDLFLCFLICCLSLTVLVHFEDEEDCEVRGLFWA